MRPVNEQLDQLIKLGCHNACSWLARAVGNVVTQGVEVLRCTPIDDDATQ